MIHPELESVFSSSNLNLLHKVLVERDDKYNVLWSPKVVHAENFKEYEELSNPHEAVGGWIPKWGECDANSVIIILLYFKEAIKYKRIIITELASHSPHFGIQPPTATLYTVLVTSSDIMCSLE